MQQVLVLGLVATTLLTGSAAAQDRTDVVMEMDPNLPLHTIYFPKNADGLLGIVAWGNGGCLNDGSNYQDLLGEVAAHGFLVIANGEMAPPELNTSTSAAQLTEAIDWALRENSREGSKHKGRFDPAQIAVMGHSCGGRQALAISSDPRVKTSVILNMGGSASETLAALHAPVLYFSGGPSDRAHQAVGSDFKRVENVPAMYVELNVGHNGTLFDEKGGAFGRVITHWLGWRLKGSAEGAAWFTGPMCTLCTVSAWTIARKNLD